jgi:hypothetical protein
MKLAIKVGILVVLCVVLCGLSLLAAGWWFLARPLLYKPSCDVQPVISIPFPKEIETLAGCPRDKTTFENGIHKDLGTRAPRGINERFTLGEINHRLHSGSNYEFIVFFNVPAAKFWYDDATRGPWSSKHYPVFKETVVDDCVACVHYTEQARSDFREPDGYYQSRATFRIHNAFIQVTTEDTTRKSDRLQVAVTNLAQMLRVALASTNHTAR